MADHRRRIVKMAVGLFVICAAMTGANGSAHADPAALTLDGCYALALKRSEEIAIHQEQIAETEGRFLQAISGVLPRVSFDVSQKRQDGNGASAFSLKNVPERKFTLTQPLFGGFKEFAAMAGSRAERRERIQQKARAEQLLLVDVSDAFYALLEQREDLKTLETIRVTLLGRLEELRERERLGRSRPSEVSTAEAQLRKVEAQMALAISQGTTAQQMLEFLTGREPLIALQELHASLPAVESESAYLAHVDSRPDVQAAKEAWGIAQKQVQVAQAKFWPDADLEGNYYTKRAGVSQDIDWDVLLKVNVPIFQGGQTVGAVREAASKARQAKLEFERAQRIAALDIRDLYARLQASMARIAALQKALEAAEESYRVQAEDYRLNLVNNLDVLEALQTLQDARRDLLHETYEAKRLYWRLRAATGETI